MSPLDRAWKRGYSPDTSVFSALETLVIIVLYKSTFTIPYHTVIIIIIISRTTRVGQYQKKHSPNQDGCEWVSVSSGTGLPGLSLCVCVCVCACACACVCVCVCVFQWLTYVLTICIGVCRSQHRVIEPGRRWRFRHCCAVSVFQARPAAGSLPLASLPPPTDRRSRPEWHDFTANKGLVLS